MTENEPATGYRFGPYRLLPSQRQLLDANGQPMVLRGKAFDLLWYLLLHRGRLVEKSELLSALWPEAIVEENNLNQAISTLRQALDDDARTPTYIATIKGRGYQFVGEVCDDAQSSANNPAPITAPTAGAGRYRAALVVIAGIVIATLWWASREPGEPASATPVVEHFADATLSIVTDYPGSHSEPTLSPDGRMMAYVSDASGTPQIWVKNLQRGDPLQLTDGPYSARSPTWSPNDDQILFERTGPEGTSIYSVGTLGSPAPTMVVEHAASPNYSARTNAFVFARNQQIWLAKNGGRDHEKIIGVPVRQGFAPPEPALSPDGKLVAFILADEGPLGNLWLIPATGGEARQLTTLETSGGIAGGPEWSENGRTIIYSVEATIVGGHLWRIDVETGETTALTAGTSGARDAAVAGNGSRLAYTVTRMIWNLTHLNPATGERSIIHQSRTPVLLPIASPDGRQIVFFTRNSTGMQVLTIDSNGDNLRQLTFDTPGENALPTWSGDGESILYYRGRSLHRLNPADGSDAEVFADFHWSAHNWLDAHGDRISYHKINRPTGQHQTVVRSLGESTEIELPVPIEAAQWSADGKELLGWFRQTGELLLCRPEAASCRNIESDGEKLIGGSPQWSRDGQQIYYLGPTEDGDCCDLFRIDVDGNNKTLIGELSGFDPVNSYYGVDANGNIFYNQLDRSTEEIWLAVIDD